MLRPRALRLAALALALALPLAAAPAGALNVLRLEAPGGPVAVGESLDVALALDFDEVTLGGAVTLAYEPTVLELLSVSFDAGLPDDPDFRCPGGGGGPVSCPSEPGFVAFGGLDGLPAGSALPVATVRFRGLAPGTSALGLSEALPFSDEAGAALDVSFVGTSTRVVPEPALGLLLGVAALAAARRRPHRRTGSAKRVA